jgi:hypothetical protein
MLSNNKDMRQYNKLPNMSSNEMPLLSDPFDATKILINTVIDKLEQNYLVLSSDDFTAQADKIDKEIKFLNSCAVKSSDGQEKVNRVAYIKKLEQRMNNVRTQYLTRASKSGPIINSFSGSGSGSGSVMLSSAPPIINSDTQQLLVKQMIDEQDAQLDLISQSVGNLKQMANTIGDELVNSNKIIDSISIKIDDADARMNYTTRAIKRLDEKLKRSCCCKTAMIVGSIVVVLIVVLIIVMS